MVVANYRQMPRLTRLPAISDAATLWRVRIVRHFLEMTVPPKIVNMPENMVDFKPDKLVNRVPGF
jgi:hypothetical protein